MYGAQAGVPRLPDLGRLQKFALELGGQSPKYLTFGGAMYPLTALQNTLIPYSSWRR